MERIGTIFVLAFLVAVHSHSQSSQCPKDVHEQSSEMELILKHKDCDKFYKCTYGIPLVQKCPEGLQFNLENSQCDWQGNVDCTGRNIPLEEPLESESEEPVETDAPQVDKEDVEEESVPEIEEGTTDAVSEAETEADTESALVMVDPNEPEEDNTSESVDDKENEFLANGCPHNAHVHWLLPHESDCNQFYSCIYGEKVVRRCGASLHFNKNLQVCDWAQDAGCIVIPKISANKHHDARVATYKSIEKPMYKQHH